MPAPNLNLGNAPNDSDDVQDLWYALEELGFSVGVVGQADYGFLNNVTLPADGRASVRVKAPGGDFINGQAIASAQYGILVRWLDDDDQLIREEGIISNREGGKWSNYKVDPKGPFAEIVIENRTNTQETASLTVHYK